MLRKRPIFAFLFLALTSALVVAETPNGGPQGAQDAESSQERRRLVAENLPLTDSEASEFWPVYDRYQQDLNRLVERRKDIVGKLGEHFDEMSDEDAKQISLEILELQESRLKLLKSYFPKFDKALPANKLVRYLQIEARIRAVVDYEIAERLPLIK